MNDRATSADNRTTAARTPRPGHRRRQLGLGVLAATALGLALPVVASAAEGDALRGRHQTEATYTVTIENTTPSQWLTPPNFAAHSTHVSIFDRGHRASAGLQALAENGAVPALAAELQAKIDANDLGVSGVGAMAPLAPGTSATFSFTTTERNFSLAAMLVCTNDGFAGIDSVVLPERVGHDRSIRVRGLDAGTEINTENRADLVPAPFCGPGEGSGTSNPLLAEHGRITNHRGILGVGDLPTSFDWSGPVAEVHITRVS